MAEAAQDMNHTDQEQHFNASLDQVDPEVREIIEGELKRQQSVIELIASENLTARAVQEAQGSILTNKYAEGYPGRRYYGGCEQVDKVEQLAIDRACNLFGCNFANVQPHSGSQAVQAVYLALLQPGDTLVSMSLDHGGHLTHGSKVNVSGKWFNFESYGVRDDTGEIDYDQAEKLALEHKPKMIVCGASAYSRVIDWARFRSIADKVGAYLLADVAHYAGLIAAGVIPNPIEHVHVATMTTHKTLRGPRSGMIIWNDETLTKKINSAIFPGLQGGPLEHVIAAKAVAFGQALKPEFKAYQQAVVRNTKILAAKLEEGGAKVLSGGTDTHVILVDLRPLGINGKQAQDALGRAHLNLNRNSIPDDPESPMVTSGIRLGAAAGTTRGFGEAEYNQIGDWIVTVLKGLSENGEDGNADVEAQVRDEIIALCQRFPIYESAL